MGVAKELVYLKQVLACLPTPKISEAASSMLRGLGKRDIDKQGDVSTELC